MPEFILQFTPSPGSNWVHLAEVTAYGSGSNCPPEETIITAPLSTTTVPTDIPTQPITSEISHATSTQPTATPETTDQEPTIIVTLVILLLLLLVGLMAAVLILWRCKHHKHHHTAKEEASQPHPHPAVSLCQETGQLQHTSLLDDDSPLYTAIDSSAQPQASAAGKGQEESANEDEIMGGYSKTQKGEVMASALYDSLEL